MTGAQTLFAAGHQHHAAIAVRCCRLGHVKGSADRRGLTPEGEAGHTVVQVVNSISTGAEGWRKYGVNKTSAGQRPHGLVALHLVRWKWFA